MGCGSRGGGVCVIVFLNAGCDFTLIIMMINDTNSISYNCGLP